MVFSAARSGVGQLFQRCDVFQRLGGGGGAFETLMESLGQQRARLGRVDGAAGALQGPQQGQRALRQDTNDNDRLAFPVGEKSYHGGLGANRPCLTVGEVWRLKIAAGLRAGRC